MNLQENIRKVLREESDLYDNPRKVVKQHNDYDLIVDKISSLKDPNKIKNIIEDWILDNEEYFADLIFDSEGEVYINCEHAAEMVSQILSDSNKKHKLQVGNIKKQSHAWVNYDGVIIDPTKSQFPGIEHNDYLEDIYWEKENMNLQESIRILREEETPKYDDGGSSVYEKEKPYQVYSPITQNVEGYFENKKEAEQFAEKFEDSIVYDIREEEKVGKEFWFEYHCFESDESCDAEIWYRSHQKVKVVDVGYWSLDDEKIRYEEALLRVYVVEWKDGFRYDVYEDELMESKNEFYRPDPPKKKDSVSNTTFDGNNPDIRFDDGGRVSNYREFYDNLQIEDGSKYIGQKFADVFPFIGKKTSPAQFRILVKDYIKLLGRLENDNYTTKGMKTADLNRLEKRHKYIDKKKYLSRFYLDPSGTIIGFDNSELYS